jgi:predicted MFS family arabinose efflux permease
LPEKRLKLVFGSIFFLTLVFFIQFLIRLLAGPLLPAIEADLSLSHSQSGIFILLIGAGIFTSQLFAPYLAARKGYRYCILVSLSGASIASAVIGLSRAMWVLNSGYLLLGFACGLYVPSGIALITVLVDKRDWGKAMGIHEIAPSVALILAPIIAAVTVELGSWRDGYLYIAMGLMMLWAVQLFLGPDDVKRPDKPDIATLKRLIVNPSSWKAIALLSIAVGIETGVYSMTPLFLVNERGFNLIGANQLLGYSRIPGLFMVMLSGWLTDRLRPSAMVRTTFLLTGASVSSPGVLPKKWPWDCHFYPGRIFSLPVPSPAGHDIYHHNPCKQNHHDFPDPGCGTDNRRRAFFRCDCLFRGLRLLRCWVCFYRGHIYGRDLFFAPAGRDENVISRCSVTGTMPLICIHSSLETIYSTSDFLRL